MPSRRAPDTSTLNSPTTPATRPNHHTADTLPNRRMADILPSLPTSTSDPRTVTNEVHLPTLHNSPATASPNTTASNHILRETISTVPIKVKAKVLTATAVSVPLSSAVVPPPTLPISLAAEP